MYQYTAEDQTIIDERVTQFRGQVARRLAGELTEDQFRPLRLMNGLYLQRHAYMLRVNVPYGLLSSEQIRMLAHVARKYDRGYGHITTRQNVQYNWPKLEQVPDLLADLASVQMHGIQSSGNCIRNVTSDHLAGVAGDEEVDPRPYCEILRQYSTFHPEFMYLPRKFKIAVTGASTDRAAILVHDIGLRVKRNEAGEIGFEYYVGGGLGRTPVIAQLVRDWLPAEDLLTYTEAVLRVYNLHGNRENKYKARIKILVRTMGVEEFRRQVEEEWERIKDSSIKLTQEELDRVASFFTEPEYDGSAADHDASYQAKLDTDPAFARWFDNNVIAHKKPGYHIVALSLKSPNRPPGDVTADQLDHIADIADTFSLGRSRTTHEQNMILSDVSSEHLYELWQRLAELELATPNYGKITDMICCPGLDFCSLANAGSIAVAKQITDHFDDTERLESLGDLKVKMSGCINACGHHHVGHIGILGIDKRGEEVYQIMLGGSAEDDASLGRWIGPALDKESVAEALDKIVTVYESERDAGERFLDTYRRLGREPFKEAVYEDH